MPEALHLSRGDKGVALGKTRVLWIACAVVATSASVWVGILAAGSGQQGRPLATTTDADRAAMRATIGEAIRGGGVGAEEGDSPSAPLSDPWAIFELSPSLDRVVALGTPAIPVLIEEIDNSPQSGLDVYLLAICVTKITKANMGGPSDTSTFWDTGKAFPAAWGVHLERIPKTVSSIAKSDVGASEKNARLVKLGTPAIPFILDEVEAGHVELAPAAESLMRGTVEMRGESSPGRVTAKWAKRNKDRFAQLRSLVRTGRAPRASDDKWKPPTLQVQVTDYVGHYIKPDNATDYTDIKPDGTYVRLISGRRSHGTYALNHNVIIFSLPDKATEVGRLEPGRLVDGDVQTWVRADGQ